MEFVWKAPLERADDMFGVQPRVVAAGLAVLMGRPDIMQVAGRPRIVLWQWSRLARAALGTKAARALRLVGPDASGRNGGVCPADAPAGAPVALQ